MLKKAFLFVLAFVLCLTAFPLFGYCEDEDSGVFPTSVSGLTNFVRLTNGFDGDGVLSSFSEKELFPYIAYLNQNGEISGKMFDAVIFSPSDSVYPSGGSLVPSDNSENAVMSDWLLYFDSIFASGKTLDALESAVGNANAKIGATEKFKVFLTVPYPKATQKAFGDIDGNGSDDLCYTLEERSAIVTWFVNKYISAFNARNFRNIELCGFYWGNSEINYSASNDESVLTSAFNKYVRDRGYKTLFGAAYCAVGSDKWGEMGFDGAAMTFSLEHGVENKDGVLDISNLFEDMNIIKNNGMGVVLKTDKAELFDSESYDDAGYNYETYLFCGRQTGYIGSFKIIEQGYGFGSLSDFCYIDEPTPKGIYLRRLYDLTYSFLRLTYANKAPNVDADDYFELLYGDEQITINLDIYDVDSHWDNIKIEFIKMPEHGKVASSSNKNALIYNVDSGFVGEDSFSVRVTDGFNISQEHEIKVLIAEPEPLSEVVSDNEDETSIILEIPSNKKEDVPPWVMITLGLLGALMLVVALAAILTSRKKE